jgi:hypothetical protein
MRPYLITAKLMRPSNMKRFPTPDTDQYRNNWKQHVQSRVPRQMMTYRPKGNRSLGRPLKRWRETVTDH